MGALGIVGSWGSGLGPREGTLVFGLGLRFGGGGAVLPARGVLRQGDIKGCFAERFGGFECQGSWACALVSPSTHSSVPHPPGPKDPATRGRKETQINNIA